MFVSRRFHDFTISRFHDFTTSRLHDFTTPAAGGQENEKKAVRRLSDGLEGSSGGDDGIRTRGLSLAKAALSQLSYIPEVEATGL